MGKFSTALSFFLVMKTQLTPSQERAYEKLDFFFKLGLNGINTVEGISPRPIPLIAGPSGSGKTFLVGNLASKYELPLFSINIPNWIVRGARNESQVTLEQIREFISSNDRGVIFLDEVNKLMANHVGQSSWVADVFTECIAFLDQDKRLDAMGLSGLVEKLKRNFIIVGAAAFQDEWQASQKAVSAIGFAGGDQIQDDQESSYEKAIQSQGTVPEELLFRFNDRLIVILPPTSEEYGKRIAGIREALLLPQLDEEDLAVLAKAAVQSGKSMRWLEGYLTECLSQLPEETLEALAETPYDGLDPVGVTPAKSNNPPKMDRKQLTAIRDAYYERYEQSLRSLSGISRQMFLLLQGVLIGYDSGVNDRARERLFESIRKMGELIAPHVSAADKQFILVGRGFKFLAEKGLGGIAPLGSSEDRGKVANDVKRIAGKLADVIPFLLAQCGESPEENSIRENALGFALHAQWVSHNLQELRKIEAERGVR